MNVTFHIAQTPTPLAFNSHLRVGLHLFVDLVLKLLRAGVVFPYRGKNRLLIVFFFGFWQALSSQNETNKWYFGEKAGLDLNTDPPLVLNNSGMIAHEACSTISDANGNILFYTNGETIWDKTHNIMANGSGLNGHFSSSQGALIVKQPGNTNLYYIFTVDGIENYLARGLQYSVVDIGLASGNGSVTIKNFPLLAPCGERMAGVKHCNGVDTWVLVHDTANSFYAYLVNSSGVNAVPVISATGLYYGLRGYMGSLKFSSDGRKLAAVSTGVDSIPFWTTGAFELFDFNGTTGIVSNPIIIAKGYPKYSYLYGCEFSSDGSKVYATRTNAPYTLLQWNLCAGTATAIALSQFTVASSGNAMNWGLQLAPNGKIYISRYNQPNLDVINDPDKYGVACNYSTAAQTTSTNNCRIGLPLFVSTYLKPKPEIGFLSNCLSVTLAIVSPSISGCAPTGTSAISWNFGDPSSGSANTSGLSAPVHVFSSQGTYTITASINYNCGVDQVAKIVNVSGCSGIEKLESNRDLFSIFPNPNCGLFTFDCSQNTRFSIVNNLGEEIKSGFLPHGKHFFDISDYADGIYTIKLNTDVERIIFKIIKQT